MITRMLLLIVCGRACGALFPEALLYAISGKEPSCKAKLHPHTSPLFTHRSEPAYRGSAAIIEWLWEQDLESAARARRPGCWSLRRQPL